MSREDVNKLYKQASGMRKRVPSRRRDEDDESPRRKTSLDEFILRLLDEERPAKRTLELRQGTAVWVGPQTVRVRWPGAEMEALLMGTRPAVGDELTIGLTEDRKTWIVTKLHPRRTKLSRPDVDNVNLERVTVANVDVIGIVVSVVAPPLHPRLIDRYLIAVQRGGALPILLVNKLDLLDDLSELSVLSPYDDLGVPVFHCSTVDGRGIADVRAKLRGVTAAFVGHSGVGKSSLLNALYPQLELDTGEVSEWYGRGTHTTTASSLHEFADGTRLIDTPGIRSFGLWKMEPEELQWYFPEFGAFTCKFRDCSHSHEPGCGVRDAAERGLFASVRYDTYLRLLEGDE